MNFPTEKLYSLGRRKMFCAGHGWGTIEICLSEKGVLTKKGRETLF